MDARIQGRVGAPRSGASGAVNAKGRASDVTLACPACGLRFDKPLVWLRANSVLACPDCREPIPVRRYKAQTGAAALFRSLTGFAGGTKGS